VTSYPEILSTEPQDAAFWVSAATASVRAYCGWHIAPVVTETRRLDGRGGPVLLLPSQKVVRIVSVLNDFEDVTAKVRVSEAGMLELASGYWSRHFGGVVVTMEHGHESAPDVAAVIAAAAARGPVGINNAGVRSDNTGPFGATYTGESIPLLASEQTTLDQYRLGWSG
jgi:hypothetical protein